MHLRPYAPADLPTLLTLFHDAVHTGCAKDYTSAQLEAWSPAKPDAAAWAKALASGATLVAEEAGAILGFGTVLPDGYLDLLYVHPSHQRRGVGAVLCSFLEFQYPVESLTVHASQTAIPFFQRQGFAVAAPQQVERRGQMLARCLMKKEVG